LAAPTHLKYRPDIDGLRAVAIGSVVLFHAFPTLLRGGFVGVDVFFVISGYLISSIVFQGLMAGDFSFAKFYQRRIKRIFPALILVLVSCFVVGWFVLLADELRALGKHTVAGVAFFQNIVLFKEAGYFDTASETKPLLHLWSLGVEEQFYIFFPITVWVLWRRPALVLPVIVVLAVASFWAGALQLTQDPSAAFYLSPFRVWEIMAGSLAGYFSALHPSQAHRLSNSVRWRTVLSAAGAALLLASFLVIDRQKAFPGFWALMPVCGSALMILAGPGAWINQHLLGCRPMVWVGLISYPLYLWHWPVMTFMRIVTAEELDVPHGLLAIAASVLLAWGTHRGLELPLRRARLRVPKTALLLGLGGVVIGVGGLTFVRGGMPSRPGMPAGLEERQAYATYFENSLPGWAYFQRESMFERLRFHCDFYDSDSYRAGIRTDEPRPQLAPECYVPTTDTKLMIWGDSHAQHYFYGLRQTLPSSVSILQVTASGCPANVPGHSVKDRKYCSRSNAFAWEVLAKEKPDVVVIAQAQGHDTDNDFSDLAARARALGVKRVIVLGPLPRYSPFLYQLVVRKHWEHTPRRLKDGVVQSQFDTDATLKNRYASGSGGLDYVSAIDTFCDTQGCLVYVGDDRKTGLVAYDYGHLTPAGSIFFAETTLAPLIEKSLAAAHPQ
jgi:peptidoglycan/LPS O-acetylase OafA/YrhL